ncbi:MAG: ATP-binding protein [Bdellovibrionales bacterium]|nr:ATP-binding protein [Bdellovibrionales bacterium]
MKSVFMTWHCLHKRLGMKIYTLCKQGFELKPIEVEISFMPGVPKFQFLGQPDTMIKESELRIRSALKHQGFELPRGQQVIVNLKPAHLKKQSRGVDLAGACAYLWKSAQVPMSPELNEAVFIYGELGLDGKVQMPDDLESLFNDDPNLKLISGYPSPDKPLYQNIYAMTELKDLQNMQFFPANITEYKYERPKLESDILVCDKQAKLLSVMATGEHHTMLAGPSGSGKTTLAQLIYKLLKDPHQNQFRLSQQIHNVMGYNLNWRPIVCPHHTTTPIALIGGGAPIFPGEITRAHSGLLVLDEFLEFHPKVQEALREPIETGEIMISRRGDRRSLPANFMLVATTNLCPCGDYTPKKIMNCRFSLQKCKSYMDKLSGPILDRFEVMAFSNEWRGDKKHSIDSIFKKVVQAQAFAKKLRGQVEPNSKIKYQHIENSLDDFTKTNIMPETGSSHRRKIALLKVARTIADLDASEKIKPHHLQQAADLSITPFEKLKLGMN